MTPLYYSILQLFTFVTIKLYKFFNNKHIERDKKLALICIYYTIKFYNASSDKSVEEN